MSSLSKQALDAWKRADMDARVAESRLLAAWELFEKQLVAPPEVEQLRQVAQLRATANEKLTIAMIELACVQRAAEHNSPAGARSP